MPKDYRASKAIGVQERVIETRNLRQISVLARERLDQRPLMIGCNDAIFSASSRRIGELNGR